ncbi:MAG: hypothetical protein OEM99_10115 [Gammaproteobacteria bacterium]|nr:hypothetical protein [Gammaproteobacteria bacterium]
MKYSYNKGPIILLNAVCTLIAALGFVNSVNAQTQYKYVATTQAKAAAEQGPVKAGSQTWKCRGNECYTSGPSATLGVGDCKALAQKVGPLASYGHSGRWLSGKELDACNAGSQKTLPSPGVIQAPRVEVGEALPSPGVAKDKQKQIKETSLSTSVIQAPKGQLKEALPSPGVTQLPSGSLPSAALSPPAQIQLSQSELDRMALTLNTIGSQRYEYVLWRRTPTQSKRMKLSVVRAESINGILLNRDKATMESLGGRYYDDSMGNLVLLGNLVDDTGGRFPYSVTATSWGEAVFGADRNNDGVIDLALGSHRGDSRLWMMANDHFKRLLQCIEESALSTAGNDMFDAASLCVPCLDPAREAGTAVTAEEMSCVNRRRNSGGSGGLLATALGKGAPNLYGEPDCAASRTPGGGITSQDRDEQVRNYREQASDAGRKSHVYLHMAGRHLARGEEELAEMAAALGTDTEAFSVDLYVLAQMIEDGEDPELIARTKEELNESAEYIRMRHSEYCAAGGVPGCQDGEPVGRSDGGGEELPRIGLDDTPQSGFQDPRCAGRETAAKRGSIWSDICYEKGEHVGMMECISRLADSIYAMTGGRCWQGSGPAGGDRIVCRQEESGRGDGSGGGSDGTPGDSGATDDPRTDRLGRSSGAGGRYIDTTPMGGFLAGFCAKIGCPGGPSRDLDFKRE